jgi:site-specific recombinase XerD
MCRKPASKRTRPKPKAVLRLPDSDQAKSAVLNSLTSADAQRGYRHAIEEFVEAVELSFAHIQQREEHWAIVDLKGKAGHTRTIPMPGWVKNVVDQWIPAANITSCKLFRRVNKMGKTWGEKLTEKAVWDVVREYATKAGIDKLSPHDLRRTCARLCHASGGELEQIQFLLGHVSVQTTERYLGCKQRIQDAVNDKIGIGPPD